jgi:hypothetical protein
MADKDFRVKQGIVVGGDAFISNSITSVNAISFDTNGFGGGKLSWNTSDGTLDIESGYGDVVLQVGQETQYIVRNSSNSSILNGTSVFCNGVTEGSGRFAVSPMIGDGSISPVQYLGLATQNIASGVNGVVTYFGYVRGLDTRGTSNSAMSVGDETWAVGDKLYVHPTVAGKLTKVEPEAPNSKICVAVVTTRHQSTGVVFVRPTTNLTVDKLSDVQLNSLVDGQSLVWVAANSRFENLTVTGDVANLYNTYTTLTANTYNTLLAAQSNDGATLASARANDYNTYTTLAGMISNTSSNTNIVAGNVSLSNTTVFIQAGDGVLLSSNTTSKTLTIATSMSNVTSQTIAITGTSNTFTLTKSAANANMVLVMYNGLVQDPSRYSISSTTLALNNVAPLIAGANIEVRYFDFFSLPGASAGGGGGGSSFQGSVSGYISGGQTPASNVIDKFPFSADSNATDVGDLTVARYDVAGQSSSTSGYTSGGTLGPAFTNVIDKFPFAANANATDVGDLTESRAGVTGQSSSTSGYRSGGSYPRVNTIDKFSFSADGNASDVGDLTRIVRNTAGQSSTTHGYTSGGYNHSISPATFSNIIDRFPFATNSNATDVGDLTQNRSHIAGQSSTASGYTSGGFSFTPGGYSYVNTIDKFPFASNANATDVGDLIGGIGFPAGQSSTVSGYASGGVGAGNNIIQKFPFAADSNATDVGDITVARRDSAGQQV